MAPRSESKDPKVTALREARCLNPHPQAVTDEVFTSQEFFGLSRHECGLVRGLVAVDSLPG